MNVVGITTQILGWDNENAPWKTMGRTYGPIQNHRKKSRKLLVA